MADSSSSVFYTLIKQAFSTKQSACLSELYHKNVNFDWQVSGTVFMDIKSACKVLSLHVFHPLDACTYFGLDNGADPIKV